MKRVLFVFLLVVLAITVISCVSIAKACGWIDLEKVELGMTFTEVMEHGPNPMDITISKSENYRITFCEYEIATLVFCNGILEQIIY